MRVGLVLCVLPVDLFACLVCFVCFAVRQLIDATLGVERAAKLVTALQRPALQRIVVSENFWAILFGMRVKLRAAL